MGILKDTLSGLGHKIESIDPEKLEVAAAIADMTIETGLPYHTVRKMATQSMVKRVDYLEKTSD